MILYFSSFSVYPSRKCIYRRLAVSPSRAAQVPHMLGFPFLIPACFWKSKTLHYISRKEETTWGNKTRLEKITCHSKKRSQLLNNLYAMCRQLFMKASHQSHDVETAQQSFSTGYGWCSLKATDGLYWRAPMGVPAACDWQYLAVCTGNSAAPHIIPTNPVPSPRVPPTSFRVLSHSLFFHLYYRT